MSKRLKVVTVRRNLQRSNQIGIPIELIERRIYRMRGHNVLLDRDLALLYGVETRTLNQAVRRNIERFPADFMFSLTRPEIRNLSQFVISSGIKHAPSVFAFTEQGVAMLSSVLRRRRAIQVNIAIMRAFVRLKGAVSSYRKLAQKLNALEKGVGRHDVEIRVIFKAIRDLLEPSPKPKRHIGFHP